MGSLNQERKNGQSDRPWADRFGQPSGLQGVVRKRRALGDYSWTDSGSRKVSRRSGSLAWVTRTVKLRGAWDGADKGHRLKPMRKAGRNPKTHPHNSRVRHPKSGEKHGSEDPPLHRRGSLRNSGQAEDPPLRRRKDAGIKPALHNQGLEDWGATCFWASAAPSWQGFWRLPGKAAHLV